MSSRQYRRPYARQRKTNDEGEEEGFLYCLMYYFDEARKQNEEGKDKKSKRHRRIFDEEEHEEDDSKKKKDDEEEEYMLNPLVYREPYGRPLRGQMMRRAYTPERESSKPSSSSTRNRAQSQPPEINHNDVSARKFRRRKK